MEEDPSSAAEEFAALAESAAARETAIPGYGEFEIDIAEILRRELPRFLDGIQPSPLTTEAVRTLPPGSKGAYLLLLDGYPVYAGKTDVRHGFRARLERHAFTVRGRLGLDSGRLLFKAVRIMVFSAFDVEAILIDEMRRIDPGYLAWNNSGFGSNDPGRRRDEQEPADFDREFPVDLDVPVNFPAEVPTVFKALSFAKLAAPYLIRYDRVSELRQFPLSGVSGPMTVRQMLDVVLDSLSDEWQVTVLHGRVIVYKENKTYQHARETMRGRL